MRKFSKEEIDNTRNHFLAQKYARVIATVGKRNFHFFVLPQELAPEVPDFVLRCTGEPEDGSVFGISESFPEHWRPYAVAHEVIEFTEIGMDAPDRCVRALEEELRLVPPYQRAAYARRRLQFFRTLLTYCSEQPEHYSNGDIQDFKQVIGKLEKLVGN